MHRSVVLAALLPFAAVAHAADVVDQSNTAIDLSANTLAITNDPASEQKLAQTFTVGIAGRLREVRVPVACSSGRLTLEIVDVDASGVPGSTVLASSSVRFNRLPDVVAGEFKALRVTGRVDVTVGQQLAFVLSNADGSCGLASAPAGDTYSGGEAFFDARPNPPGWIRQADAATPTTPFDLAFETVVRE